MSYLVMTIHILLDYMLGHLMIYICVCHILFVMLIWRTTSGSFGGAATETEGRGQESGAGRGDGEA
jgi:hypothetical protein